MAGIRRTRKRRPLCPIGPLANGDNGQCTRSVLRSQYVLLGVGVLAPFHAAGPFWIVGWPLLTATPMNWLHNQSSFNCSPTEIPFSHPRFCGLTTGKWMTIQPIGAITAYAGTSPPNGWLLCDGKAIPPGSQYDELRHLVGTNTPDLQGYFLRGLDQAGKVDPGRKLLDIQSDGIGPHTHTYNNSYIGPAGLSGAGAPNVVAYIDHNAQTGAQTPAPPGETRPKNKTVSYIIKAVDEG